MNINKHLLVLLFLVATIGTVNAQVQEAKDSSEFFGRKFLAPAGCEANGNMIKCSDYIFTWIYEPAEDIPRHQKELVAQLEKPKKLNVIVNGKELTGYQVITDTYNTLLITGVINGKGAIINLWQDKIIKTTADLPECVRQFISIKGS